MEEDEDDITVVASNVTRQSTKSDDATASTASMSNVHANLPYYPTYAKTYQTSRPARKTHARKTIAISFATSNTNGHMKVSMDNNCTSKQPPTTTAIGTIFNQQRLVRAVKHAISDSGTTGHFLVEGAPVINKTNGGPSDHDNVTEW